MSNIRLIQPSDIPFVRSAWSSSYRTSYYAGMIHMSDYADIMHRQIDRILAHETTSVLVSEEPDELDHEGRSFIYGFLAYHKDLFHYREHCNTDSTSDGSRLVAALRAARRIAQPGAPYIYYIYVKAPYRSPPHAPYPYPHHATRLFDAAGIDPAKAFAYACRTPYCAELSSKIPLAQYNPLPARYL